MDRISAGHLRYHSAKLQIIPAVIKGNYKNFDKLFGVINFAGMSAKDQEVYENELRWILNRNSEIAAARENGLAEGEAKGREEGALDKALETARNLKAVGIGVEVICQCTGLTLEQIAKL